MNSYKIFKYFAIVIGVISLYYAIRVFAAGDESLAASPELQSSVISPFLYLGYIAFFATIALVLFFSIKGLFTGDTKKTLILLGTGVAIVLVSYLFTSGEAKTLKDGEVLSAAADHWISTGLAVLYILVVISLGAMLLNGVNKLIKR